MILFCNIYASYSTITGLKDCGIIFFNQYFLFPDFSATIIARIPCKVTATLLP